jgi:hypothetical protein
MIFIDDVLMTVFSYLTIRELRTIVTLVNTQWYAAVKDDFVWEKKISSISSSLLLTTYNGNSGYYDKLSTCVCVCPQMESDEQQEELVESIAHGLRWILLLPEDRRDFWMDLIGGMCLLARHGTGNSVNYTIALPVPKFKHLKVEYTVPMGYSAGVTPVHQLSCGSMGWTFSLVCNIIQGKLLRYRVEQFNVYLMKALHIPANESLLLLTVLLNIAKAIMYNSRSYSICSPLDCFYDDLKAETWMKDALNSTVWDQY